MVHVKKTLLKSACILGVALFSQYSAAEIKVGTTTALSGPAEQLGKSMKLGIETYFAKVNESGGVDGEKISMVALDDGYEPNRAGPNMRKLIDDEKVLAILGNVGTPTAVVTVPIANEKKALLFGAYTGAGVLRNNPPDRYVINYRASYAEETAAMVEGLMSAGIKPEEIAFFTQNDGYGDAGYNGAMKALEAKGYKDARSLTHGRYERNTTNVEEGLTTVLDADVEPRAVIMVGAYKPISGFIKLAKEELPETVFLNVSFVGSIPLMQALGDKGEGVIVTQVVPHYDSDTPIVKEYREALKKHGAGSQPGFISLEGYIVGKLFVEGLKKSGAKLTTENIIDGLQSLGDIDLGTGKPVHLSGTEHQASHTVWPTVIKNGEYVDLNWGDL